MDFTKPQEILMDFTIVWVMKRKLLATSLLFNIQPENSSQVTLIISYHQ